MDGRVWNIRLPLAFGCLVSGRKQIGGSELRFGLARWLDIHLE